MNDDVAVTLKSGAVVHGTVKGRMFAARQRHDPSKFGKKYDVLVNGKMHRNIDEHLVTRLEEPINDAA